MLSQGCADGVVYRNNIDIPLEIILHIASFLPEVPYPCRNPEEFLYKDRYHRSRSLLALSQTSSSLREMLTPWFWETFEVGMGSEDVALCMGKEERQIMVAEEMMTRCEMLLENQHYCGYVRTMNVVIPGSFIGDSDVTRVFDRTYQIFSRLLRFLPNLHTVQILAGPPKIIPLTISPSGLNPSEMYEAIGNSAFSRLKDACQLNICNQVRNLVLPLDGYSLCGSFPGALTVTLIPNVYSEAPEGGEHHELQIVEIFSDQYGLQHCSKMEYLHFPEEWDMYYTIPILMRMAPKMRDISHKLDLRPDSLFMTTHFRWIAYLSYSLRYLRVVHFCHSSRSELHAEPDNDADIKWVIAKTKQCLTLAPWTEEDLINGKEIKIWYGPRGGPYHDVETIAIKPPTNGGDDEDWKRWRGEGGGSVDLEDDSDDEIEAPWM